ncbi:MAG: hypothetical protein SF182_04785 [Deltaproteobacteria bacterium]|nr:hypothetical protein [Deltaproteobacteria bacterium]
MRRRRLDQRGSVMTLALGFLVVLLVIAAGVHKLVLGQLRSAGSLRQSIAAQQMAEGGVARARAWFSSISYQMPASTQLVSGVPTKLASNKAAVVLPTNHPDAYTDAYGTARKGVVEGYKAVLTKQTTSLGTYDVTASLIAQEPETWETLATAQVGGVKRVVGELLMREAQVLFSDALFGANGVSLVGNASTDGYDASLGGYGGANLFDTGSVRSNLGISLSGNATVRGDAMPGPTSTVSLSGNSKVTGLTDPAKSDKALAPASVPANAVALGELKLSGNSTRTLSAGTYVATSLAISGNSELIINAAAGPVVLYVTGAIDISGNGISNALKPKDFSLVQVGGASVQFSGNAVYTGTVYAPESALSVNGNGVFFGSYVGESVNLNGNAVIHYDRSLRSLSGPPGPLRVVAQWHQ